MAATFKMWHICPACGVLALKRCAFCSGEEEEAEKNKAQIRALREMFPVGWTRPGAPFHEDFYWAGRLGYDLANATEMTMEHGAKLLRIAYSNPQNLRKFIVDLGYKNAHGRGIIKNP